MTLIDNSSLSLTRQESGNSLLYATESLVRRIRAEKIKYKRNNISIREKGIGKKK